MAARYLVSLVLALALVISLVPLAQSSPEAQPVPDLVQSLVHQTGGEARVAYHPQTGKVSFLGSDRTHPFRQPVALPAGSTAEEAARQFLAAYGKAFGLADQAKELQAKHSRKTGDRSVVRFQQVHDGVPVLGGELIVQTDASGNVLSASGEMLPRPAVATVPKVEPAVARAEALKVVAREYRLPAEELVAGEPSLWIYDPALLKPGPSRTSLVWRLDVRAREMLPIHELVLVDAQVPLVTLHFNQIDSLLYRKVYDNANNPSIGLPGNEPPARVEGGGASAVADVNLAYEFSGDTYNYYLNMHERDSIDGLGMYLVSTVQYCPDAVDCPYQNAFWNGQQMVYGAGFASADDVVGHELTHGVTQYESGLFYFYQSGAINEALSDIWGELIDQYYNHPGIDTDTPESRWLMGEDLSIGALRNMQDPTNPPNPCTYPYCESDQNTRQPDKMSSPYYFCGDLDNGGVHLNSGVANKAAYLMVDGGTFNGKTVSPLGAGKTVTIWYEAQANLLTSGSDYLDLYNGLQQACTNLVGTAGITEADCQEVKDALDAVEMSQQPPACPAPEAALCPAGEQPADIFLDNLENTASGNWTSAATTGSNRWYYPQIPNPYGFDATYATSGDYNIWGYNQDTTSDAYFRLTAPVALPAASTSYLHFKHAYMFEDAGQPPEYYDGGVLEYSLNGGTSWLDAGSLLLDNGYVGSISASYGNPLGGRSGFVGDTYGYISSRADLTSLAGQNVLFRFRMGTDSSVGDYGWFIDDVRVYTCTTGETPTPTATPGTPTPPGYDVYLPLVMKPATPTPTPTPSGPKPGFWVGDYEELYVTPDRAYVDNFAMYFTVDGCGNFKVTHNPPEPITGNAFSFTGAFYASGTFSSQTTVSGTDGLNNLYIPQCGGYVSSGPWSWSASWYDSSQPQLRVATLVEPAVEDAVPAEGRSYRIVELR